MFTLCSAFPTGWPNGRRQRFYDAIARHWLSAQLVAEPFDGSLQRARLEVPAAVASNAPDGDIVAWLDPDIEPFSDIPSFVVPHLIKSADLCFAGSEATGPILSFWAARMNDATRRFFADVRSVEIVKMKGVDIWASALDSSGAIARDLAPGGFAGVWEHGPLGRYSRRAG